MKLWQQNSEINETDLQKKIHQFTVGSDPQWDILLAEVDVEGSMAHATMLQKVGLITEQDLIELMDGLEAIKNTIISGNFVMDDGIEDVHSQIEYLLTKDKGDVGKKIHTGRSRNDQSLLDIKLFIRSEIKKTVILIHQLFNTLIGLSEKHKSDLLPGYTHLQLAMPSSFGLWFGAYAESLSDDMELIIAAYNVANKNPLGSGAGYGSSLPLDREMTTKLLQFNSTNINVIYAQMTRGKVEKITAMALTSVAATLGKMCNDVCLYLNQQFSFIHFPNDLTTGSSIMPHKKNPDVFELIRAKCAVIQSTPNQITLLTQNLTSGYHRDLQLTKECLFPSIISLKDCLQMMNFMLQHISVTPNILDNEKFKPIFTVEAVNDLVLNGVPFRDAYQQVGKLVNNQSFVYNKPLTHTHIGSMGNLCNDMITKEFEDKVKQIIN